MGTKDGAIRRWNKKYPGGHPERFKSKIRLSSSNSCWIWTGTQYPARYGSPYGQFWTGKKLASAHRYSLELHLGRSIKNGFNVLHTCDTPLCVNPEHLYEGTQKENNKDAYARGHRSGKKQSDMLLAARKTKLGY